VFALLWLTERLQEKHSEGERQRRFYEVQALRSELLESMQQLAEVRQELAEEKHSKFEH
jgi:hypothetical protein